MEAQTTHSEQLGPDGYPLDIYRPRVPLSELKPETLNYLKGWQRPRHAYILFEKRQWHLGGDMKLSPGTGLCTLTVEHRPEQEWKLSYYVLKKRFRIIDWGNFPKANDPNPARAAKAKMYSGQNGANPWDSLEQSIIGLVQSNPNWKEEKANIEKGYQAKIAAMEKRLQEAEKNEQEGKRTKGKADSVPT